MDHLCGCAAEVLTCVWVYVCLCVWVYVCLCVWVYVCLCVWGGAVRGGAGSAAFSPHPEQDNRWCQLRR
jgi:hypothetical protein